MMIKEASIIVNVMISRVRIVVLKGHIGEKVKMLNFIKILYSTSGHRID